MFAPVPLTHLLWQSRFVERLPGDPVQDNHVRAVRSAAYSEVQPTAVRAPRLIGWSERLAGQLGILRPAPDDLDAVALLAGNRVFPGMRPYASRYGGHQFGNWAGQLGDGRAITLGEIPAPGMGRVELQLKGAGPTPYSRRADGRAVLRSSVREFLCSEAMHFLGVPTTRALSLVTTGEAVVRDMFYDGHPKEEPGAVVCRVSPSFLRFGSFEILAAQGEHELLKELAQLLIHDHFPELDPSGADVHGLLLDEICRRTARLVAHWMRVGFVHGVMNTDNMSVLGLTIDYGPYGWLEPFDPDWTPNTTDAEGRRYSFGNQPAIAQWNLARLCEAFHPLIQDEARLQASLEVFNETFAKAQSETFSAKLGIHHLESADDHALVQELFQLLQATETDYTLFFRGISDWVPGAAGAMDGQAFLSLISPAFHEPGTVPRERWTAWADLYAARLRADGAVDAARDAERRAAMKRVNPKYVLRNYLAQTAISAAEKGDPSVLDRLLRVLETPYDEMPKEEDLAVKRPEWAREAPGCSALSCSS